MEINQIDLILAVMNEIARQDPEAKATVRQYNSIIKACDDIVLAFKLPDTKSTPGSGIKAWRQTDDVGRSSDYMAAILGPAGIREYAHPHDPADFGRCLTLLAAAPDLRQRLPMMANESKEWAALVNHWDELENLYNEELPTGNAPKLYNKMRELLSSEEA